MPVGKAEKKNVVGTIPDPVYVEASTAIEALAADKGLDAAQKTAAPLTPERWSVRQTAVNRWLAFKGIRESAGEPWPELTKVIWPGPTYQSTGFSPAQSKLVEADIERAQYQAAWEELWTQATPSSAWLGLKEELIGSAPDVDEITKHELDEWTKQCQDAIKSVADKQRRLLGLVPSALGKRGLHTHV